MTFHKDELSITIQAREAVVNVFYEFADLYVQMPQSVLSGQETGTRSDNTRRQRLIEIENALSEISAAMETRPFPRRLSGEVSVGDPGAHQWLRELLTEISELSDRAELTDQERCRTEALFRVLSRVLNKGPDVASNWPEAPHPVERRPGNPKAKPERGDTSVVIVPQLRGCPIR